MSQQINLCLYQLKKSYQFFLTKIAIAEYRKNPYFPI